MSDEILFDGATFSGRARLFPLPNLVVFPHVVQPLHIFEPRYRELMEDALAGDKLIAMAVLSPGWEDAYEERPAIYPVACLGRIATHERLPDGRFNLLLVGLRRLEVVRELPTARLYREADARLLDDVYAAAGQTVRETLHARLLAAFRRKLQNIVPATAELEKLLSVDMPLGTLTDLIGYTLDFDIAFKAELLGELDIDRRAQRLIEKLHGAEGSPVDGGTRFPPDFSRN